MPKEGLDSFSQARKYAFSLLKIRLLSEEEVLCRLKKKGFGDALIKKTLLYLRQLRFVDDRAFSKAWVNSRLRQSFGFARVREELARKGIAEEVIDSEIKTAGKGYSESKTIEAIAKLKLKKLENISPIKAKSRVYGYLARRGFPPDLIADILNKL